MRTVTYNLLQLLTEAKRNAFVIPRFQRKFVWNQSQVKLLVDSVARNYPIGSLLLLQETDATNPFLASRSIDASLEEDESDVPALLTPSGAFYVLDGQQRLTSLVRVLLQATPETRYYFDLQEMNQIDESDRNPAAWIVKRKASQKMPLRYLPSELALDKDRASVRVQEYFFDEEQPKDRTRRDELFKSAARVGGYFETIRNFQVPLVIIDRSDSTEAICRIFETINSTGTRLTTFDLAVARYFPVPDLQQLWSDVREKYPMLRQFDVEGERLLQVVAILEGHDSQKYIEVTRGTLLSLDRRSIERRWDVAAKALADAYAWAEQRGGVPGLLANEALLVPLAYFFSQVREDWKHSHPNYTDILNRWYFASILQQGARQAGNYRVALATGQLRTWLADEGEPDVPEVVLNPADILALSKTDNRYRALHALLRWHASSDLWTGEPLHFEKVEDHHIFPAACAKRNGIPRKYLDSIANRILVSTVTNRKLSDRLPEDYLSSLLQEADRSGTGPAKRAMLAKACIPTNASFKTEDAIKFLEARASLLIELCQRLLGDRFRTTGTTESSIELDDD